MKMKIVMILGVTSLLSFAPSMAEAASCRQGSVKVRSTGQCISKTSAIRQGIYQPRKSFRKAFKKARYVQTKKERAPRSQIKSAAPIKYPKPTAPWSRQNPFFHIIDPVANREVVWAGIVLPLIKTEGEYVEHVYRWTAWNAGKIREGLN